MKRLVVLIVLLLMIPSPAQAESFQSETIRYVNQARAEGAMCGSVYYPPVGPVKKNKKLARAARKHSKDMARKNYFSHYSLNGRSPFKRIKREGYRYRNAGEVIAAGQRTPRRVVDAWLASPSHCRVIMNGKYKHVGFGFTYETDSKYHRYWVLDFGRRK